MGKIKTMATDSAYKKNYNDPYKSNGGLIKNPIQPNYGYTNVNITDPYMKEAYAKATGYAPDPHTASGFRPVNDSYNKPLEAVKPRGAYKKTSGGGSFDFSFPNISAPSIGHIGQFAPSQAYIDAMNYTQSLLDKINSGRTSYSDKVDEMMAKIEGRDPFSYDFNNDPLFQNMLGSAMAQGQTAMQDTMGQAAALTGGYGSSYATSAGNQAYNQFVQNAYAQLPEYYKLALDAYTREGDEMYRQLGMYSDADDREYGRLTTAYGLNYQQAQDMYGHEYNNFWDTANYNFNVDKFNADAAMEAARFNASQALDREKFEYSKKQDALARADKLSSSSASGASSGISSSEWNSVKSDLKAYVEKYGADSEKIDNYILSVTNKYNLTDSEISELGDYARLYNPKDEFSVVPYGNGNVGVKNQYGRVWSGENVTFTPVKTDSTNKNNSTYVDNYGRTWTYNEIKAYGLEKKIRK